jgi:nitrite reductase (cytochrome c-552)
MTAENSKTDAPQSRRPKIALLFALAIVSAGCTAVIAGLLVNIFQRKQEAKNPYLRFVDVSNDTTDPAEWGKNWPREYDGYLRTVLPTRTKYGGGAPSEGMLPPEKAEKNPWLTRMFAGYAFAIDYRDRRGHANMLADQEGTKRTKERKQPGSCLHCHASVIPLYRQTGAEIVPTGSPGEQLQKRLRGHRQAGLLGGQRQTGKIGPQASGFLRRLPRSQKHAATCDAAWVHQWHQGAQGPRGHR